MKLRTPRTEVEDMRSRLRISGIEVKDIQDWGKRCLGLRLISGTMLEMAGIETKIPKFEVGGIQTKVEDMAYKLGIPFNITEENSQFGSIFPRHL